MDVLDERHDDRPVDGRIRRSNLDGPVCRVGSNVEPQLSAVVDRASLDHPFFELLELLEIIEVGWDARVRQVLEDLSTPGGQAGIESTPERRVGRQREQWREIPPEFVGDPDCLVGIVDAHMDVEPGSRISMLWVLDPF